MKTLLFLSLFFVVYPYAGYGLIIWLLVRIRRLLKAADSRSAMNEYEPEVTLIVPAYNEMGCLAAKLENSLALTYSPHRLHLLFVTEGSTDGSTEYLLAQKERIGGRLQVIGGHERLGKVEAMNRAMKHVETPVVIFTDANTRLNPQAIRRLVRHFSDPVVGAVAGEKRIVEGEAEAAAGAGEGLYWRYESFLKRLDAELHTIVGAAGELFAVRTALYQPVEPDTLLDDFMISLRIAAAGYRVAYEPDAYAMERPSFSVLEEQKRKARIAHGGFQSMSRLLPLLNPFRYGWLTFQYVSHRALRWAVTPFCLPLIWLLNLCLAAEAFAKPAHTTADLAWLALFIAQTLFYTAAYVGYRLESRHIRWKLLFVPFYFVFMNWCVWLGLLRFLRGDTFGGKWERARRADEPTIEPVLQK